MRRAFPWWLVLLAFVVVPFVEIYVIIQVGKVIGAWWTIILLVADSIFGAWLLRREGGRAWRSLRLALQERRMPARELADGILILVGGTLMLTPGFVSDAFGVLCVLPVTRPVGRRLLGRALTKRLLVTPFGPTSPSAGPASGPSPGRPDPGRDEVVRGEVVDPPD